MSGFEGTKGCVEKIVKFKKPSPSTFTKNKNYIND